MIYVRLDNNKVVEVIQPFILDGKEVPIKERFSEDFTKTLVQIPSGTIAPDIGLTYKNGEFSLQTESEPTGFSVEELRLTAYAHPLTGSDRYFSEALALQAEGFAASSVEVKELKQKGLVRKTEIREAYPKE